MATATAPQARNRHQQAAKRRGQVLYDGDCKFCRKSVEALRRLDWLDRLDYMDVRDPDALADVGVSLEPGRLLEEMHLVTPDGAKVYSGFRAFRWIAWRLPLLWVVAPLLYLPGAESVGQRMYLWVARNRFRLLPCHGGVCTLPR